MMQLRHKLVALLGVVGLASACGMSADASLGGFGAQEGSSYSDSWDAGTRANATTPAGPASSVNGSPLCRINFTCAPDDLAPAACLPSSDADGGVVDAGALPPPNDGGAVYLDAGPDAALAYDGGITACRVVMRGNEPTPVCAPAGPGKDGAECRASSDCGAGFECVGTPGQCRRYCCLGSASCSSDRICDKEMVTGSEVWVPVCVPQHPCKLLAPGACPEGDTCGIVNQTNGQTSCIVVGTASVGDSCELTNCDRGLTCLGAEGERTCFKLCSKADPECPADYKCKGTTPLFQELDQGVCIPDVASKSGGAGNSAWQ